MARVFVSHASEDIALARELYQWLGKSGHEVFLDQHPRDGIAVGDEWEQRLQERLRWTNAMVCVVTSAYVASDWCSAEVRFARFWGIRLLPVRAEPGVIHVLLKSIQHTDLTRGRETARATLTEALRRVDHAGDLGWPDDRCPFPGLRPFDVGDQRVFFARTREVEQLTERLRSMADRAEGAVLLMVGPSGCGKSSLLRAGLLPAMAGEPGWWTLPPMVPGADPVGALARELAAASREIDLNWSVDQVRRQLDGRDDTSLTRLAGELLLAASGGRRRLLVVVDQFEELLTQTPPESRARFVGLLRSALSGPVRVVATLRPEFLDQLLSDVALAPLPTAVHLLRPLHRDALRQVIEEPARVAGITVDDHLLAQLIDDTSSGEALPLLAFTLAQLADGLGRGGQLSPERYAQLGGVQGALARQADAALTEAVTAGGRSRKDVIEELMRLITVDEQGHPTRRRILRDELLVTVITELDPFLNRRLVLTDRQNGSVVIGLAHEAFLSAWPPLAQAIDENRSALRARRVVEHAATEWDVDHRPSARLWERGQLAAAMADTGARFRARELVTERIEISPVARTFLRVSIRRDRVRRGRAITVLSVLLVIALIAAGIAVRQQRIAEQQRDVAVSQQLARSALELRTTNPALATQLSLIAHQFADTTEARGSLLSTAANPYATWLTGQSATVYAIAFSHDGRRLATGNFDNTARLWDVGDSYHPNLLSTLTGHTKNVNSVAFSPDDHILATASDDNTARLWDLSDPHQPRLLNSLTGHTNSILSMAFSPDGHTLATAGRDNTVRLWNVSDPRHPNLLSILTGHTAAIHGIAFSPDGHTLATASRDNDNAAWLWDVSDPQHPNPNPLSTTITSLDRSPVNSVAFSPDGHTLAIASDDNAARLWDISDLRHPTALGTLAGHTRGVWSVAYSPDGHSLATASVDRTARLWDVSDLHNPQQVGAFTSHTDQVQSVAFSPDGHILATASADTTARLWALPDPIMARHTKTVSSVAFSRDGRILATASSDNGTGSEDKTARLWDVSDSHHPIPLSVLTGHTSGLSSVAFSPDHHTLATGSYDGTARLWDIHDPRHPHMLEPPLNSHTLGVYSVAFSPDGRILATANFDKTAQLWDVSDPQHPNPTPLSILGHDKGLFSVAFSPDGRILATGSRDKNVRLWDVHDPRQPHMLSTLTGHTGDVNSVAFSPDGRTLATADRTARLWDIHDPLHPTPLGFLTGPSDGVHSVVFSPDGHTLAAADADGTARLWDVGSPHHPRPLETLTGHTSAVYSVAFSPDGHTLATGSEDTTARLWETNAESVAARVCAIAWPVITRNEWDQYLPGLPYRPPCP